MCLLLPADTPSLHTGPVWGFRDSFERLLLSSVGRRADVWLLETVRTHLQPEGGLRADPAAQALAPKTLLSLLDVRDKRQSVLPSTRKPGSHLKDVTPHFCMNPD